MRLRGALQVVPKDLEFSRESEGKPPEEQEVGKHSDPSLLEGGHCID